MTPRTGIVDRVGRYLISGARAVRNIATDVRCGHLMGRVPGVGAGSSNSDHQVLRGVFAGSIRPGDVLVDIGCGRGRVLAAWLRFHPAHDVVGIEVDRDLAAGTARRFRDEPRCRVIAGDAVVLLPADATLLFMFNPFARDTVERLCAQLAERPVTDPPLRILYSNPNHLAVFERSPAWRIERVRLGGGRLIPHHDLAVVDRRLSFEGSAPGV